MSNPIAPHEAPDFAEFITDLVDGSVNQKLSAVLAEVTEAVKETGLVGEVKISLKVSKQSGRALVDVKIDKKVPEYPQHGTMFFFGHSGLVREDPKQLTLKGLSKPQFTTIKGDD